MEELDVGMKCIKYMLFVTNFMFVMIGFLLISIGTTIKAIYGDFDLFMETHYASPATLAIAVGITIFFVAIFGCIGAIKESTCLINMFALLLSIVLVLEVATSIAAYTSRSNLTKNIEERMTESMEVYYNETCTSAKDVWDFTQSRLECCGVHNYKDWVPLAPIDTTTNSTQWPESCCGPSFGECSIHHIRQSGCLDHLVYIVSEMALLLGCGALSIAFIQLLGLIFAVMLAKAVRRLKTQHLVERDQNIQRMYEQMARGTDDKPSPVLYTPTFSEA